MLILKGDLLKDIISPLEVIEAVENAMVLYEGDDFIMPARMHAEHDGNMLLLMPSFIKSAFGTKDKQILDTRINDAAMAHAGIFPML